MKQNETELQKNVFEKYHKLFIIRTYSLHCSSAEITVIDENIMFAFFSANQFLKHFKGFFREFRIILFDMTEFPAEEMKKKRIFPCKQGYILRDAEPGSFQNPLHVV